MLYALLALFALLTLLLLLQVNVHVCYKDGTPAVYLKILFFKKSIYSEEIPRPEKPKKRKPAKKKRRKKSAAAAEGEEEPKKKTSLEDILNTVGAVRELVGSLKDKFARTLKVTAATVYVSVGSDNAAKTALLYGAICQGVTFLLELLDNVTRLKTVKKTYIHVGCDFSSEKTVAEMHLILSMRVYHLLGHALRALKTFLMIKLKNETKNHKKDGKQT